VSKVENLAFIGNASSSSNKRQNQPM